MQTLENSEPRPSGRLSKQERRSQLIQTARSIIREEGTDRLTLSYLAERAGVSKPIAYEHFGSRAGLLVDLYKTIDAELASVMKDALTAGERSFIDTAHELAAAYMHCASDTSGEWHQVGAALDGTEERATVHQELLESYVDLFVAVLSPYSSFEATQLKTLCIALVGAGDALSVAMLRGDLGEEDASRSFAHLIVAGLDRGPFLL